MRASRRRPRARDWAWAAVAVVWGASALALVVLGLVLAVRFRRWGALLWLPPYGFVAALLVAGAWRRTTWGAPPPPLEWRRPDRWTGRDPDGGHA